MVFNKFTNVLKFDWPIHDKKFEVIIKEEENNKELVNIILLNDISERIRIEHESFQKINLI